MAREVSQTALQAVLAEETNKVFLACLKISHPDMATDIRVVHDKQDLTRSDGTYIAFPFKVNLPSDSEDNIPKVNITIGNVDQTIIKELRKLTDPPTIRLEVVLASSPNTVEVGPFDFELKNISYDAFQITGELGYAEDFLNEPFPKDTFNPNTARGMFS